MLTILALLAASQVQLAVDPVRATLAGQAQCYSPDVARKACVSMASYERVDGRIVNRAVVLLGKSPAVTMETAGTVTISNGAICGAVTERDIRAAKLVADGNPVDPQAAASVLERMVGAMSAVLNKQICTTYVADGDMLLGKVKIEGAAQAEPDEHVRWVSLADGFSVKP